MKIRDVRARNRDKTLFIFEFESEEEVNIFFSNLHTLKDDCKDEKALYDRFYELIDTLESRCDDKYARDGVVKSAFMFQDEMVSWFWCWYDFVQVLYVKYDKALKGLNEALEGELKAMNRFGEMLNKCIELTERLQELESRELGDQEE